MDKNILAKVEDIEITKEHLMNIMRSLPQQQMMEVSTVEGRKRLLDEIVAGELFYLEAVENKVEEEEEFLRILEETKHSLLQRFAVQKLLEKVTVSEEACKEYYDNNTQQFVSQEEVRAKHILVNEEEKAKEIREEIKAGKSFDEAAKEYSTCPSKDKGGDLGFFTKGRMVPEFDKAAFELEVGELSDLVKTQFGYHLIIVEEKKESSIKTYEQVKDQIKQNLLRTEQTKVYTDKFNDLKGKYSVEINEDELK
ncbi:MAG: peptidylprolyl isomerase [Vallitalea sp.]|jgi:peptidyl-prolyl cis-trans isomerase C|nr:peptidylprolyl isomerase [Vallitalea sp.]